MFSLFPTTFKTINTNVLNIISVSNRPQNRPQKLVRQKKLIIPKIEAWNQLIDTFIIIGVSIYYRKLLQLYK